MLKSYNFALIGLLLLTPLSALSGQGPAAPATVAATPASTAQIRPPRILASAFAERAGIDDMSLSPDGNKIALRAVPSGELVHLAVLDAATRTTEHNLAIPDQNELEWFRWAGNRRLIVSLSRLGDWDGEDVRYSRLFVYDLDTKAFSYVGKRDIGVVGDDVLFVDPTGQFVLLAMQRTIYEWPSVWRFPLDETAQKSGKMVQGARRDVWDWYADNDGVVRLGFEWQASGAYKVLYRKSEHEAFKAIGKINSDQENANLWQILRIVTGSDEGFVLDRDSSGKVALRKFDYATGLVGETVYAQAGWDIDNVTLDENNQPFAVFYTDDRDRVVWFSPVMKALQIKLDKALKGSDVWISSRAKDDSRMLVWAGHASDPGAWYLYTAKTKHLEMVYADKPKLDPAQLTQPRPVAFKARDGVAINGYLTLPVGREAKNLPLIILPHGGPYGVRDKLRFDDEVQFLANRGYAVLQANYRGSGGYGEDFSRLGDGQIGRKMQDDLDDAMDWAVAQGFVDAARVCVVGSSYGGYAALWAVIRNPERYRCAASFAGVTDWTTQLRYDSNFFTRAANTKWKKRINGEQSGFNLDQVSPVKQAARLTRPVLLVHGEKDTNVPFKQFKAMRDAAAKAGKPLEVLTFVDEGHGFDKAENETKWLETLDAFLQKNNPAD